MRRAAVRAAPGAGTQTSTGRVGLQTDSLSDEQWTALEALLAAATGSAENEGFDEIVQHLEADDYLADNGGGDTYGRGNYFIAFLGTPSDTGTWELQFGGHHLALANTYTNGALAGATPSFRGIEPFSTVEVDGDTVQPEQQEQQAFAALLTSLDTTQSAAAKLSTSYTDILLGPGKDWAFPDHRRGRGRIAADRRAEGVAARGDQHLRRRRRRRRRGHHPGQVRERTGPDLRVLLGHHGHDQPGRLHPHRRPVGVDRVLHAERDRAQRRPPARGVARQADRLRRPDLLTCNDNASRQAARGRRIHRVLFVMLLAGVAAILAAAPASAHVVPSTVIELDVHADDITADLTLPAGDLATASGLTIAAGRQPQRADRRSRSPSICRTTWPSPPRDGSATGMDVQIDDVAATRTEQWGTGEFPAVTATATLTPPDGADLRSFTLE